MGPGVEVKRVFLNLIPRVSHLTALGMPQAVR